nr:glycosyltransferase [Planctomycetales bacterium]
MISAVIPVLNEAESLEQLHGELDAVATQHGYRLDIIFVDDGSTDHSWAVIRRLASQDPRVHGIRFRRNFGKAAALRAGFDAAQGDLVMTLDGDLQDNPHEIPHFLEKLKEGYDVVSGWKKVRHDPWHKVIPSRIFNWLARRLTGVRLHDHNCGMKCYRREVLADLHLYGEMHRFVPVLAAAKGFRIGELTVQHRPRLYGKSKYGAKRLLKGFLDLLTVAFLTGFGHRP